jgi:tetratricopeptide (TPR) repeat protein
MTDRRRRVMEVLTAALDATPASRTTLVAELCGDDVALRRKVESLLALEDDAASFLAAPPVPLATDGGRADPEIDRRLGPYRLVELLGRGGMGAVYRAVREDDFEQQVAVKLIRRELARGSVLHRFHAERAILARFDHPSIARLFDGGTTDDGRPYLVMERVDGLPVTEYCDVHRLSTARRLELFRQIVLTVAYAHQNLVVHRDLKPANILVTAEGVPKLLDFGIAKLLDPEGGQESTTGSRALTPRYASPEQIDGEGVSTVSDVYSLGVLLYQLLTGRLPCGLDDCTPHDVPRRICETPPDRPSTVVTDTVASVRDGSPRKLRRRLAGDVDAIVLKALRKEPRQRYASAEQLAADLRRHLQGLPVQARRGAWTYRVGKLARRYRWAVAALVLILSSSVVSTVQWRRAEQERRQAVAERDRSERVSKLMKNLIKSANPDVAQGRELTAREILEEGREQLADVLEKDPELAATLAGALGDVYRNLGVYDEALELLEHAARLRRALHPEGHEKLAVALNDLAGVHYYLEHSDAAVRLFREALAMRRRVGQEPPAIARGLSNLASALKQQGDWDEAAELYAAALAIREEVFGPDAAEITSSLYALGALDFERGNLERAPELLRRALAIRVAVLGERHTRVATVESTLGRVLHARGELAEAETLQRRALASRRELLGEEHVGVAVTRRDLAAVLLERGQLAEADELIQVALASLRRLEPPDDWSIAAAESVWGGCLAARGRFEEAEPLLARSLAALVAAKGEASIYTRQARARLDALPGRSG